MAPKGGGLGGVDAGAGEHRQRDILRVRRQALLPTLRELGTVGSAQAPGLLVPLTAGRVHGHQAAPAFLGTAAVGLHLLAMQEVHGRIGMLKAAQQTLVGGARAQREAAAMTAAHDLG